MCFYSISSFWCDKIWWRKYMVKNKYFDCTNLRWLGKWDITAGPITILFRCGHLGKHPGFRSPPKVPVEWQNDELAGFYTTYFIVLKRDSSLHPFLRLKRFTVFFTNRSLRWRDSNLFWWSHSWVNPWPQRSDWYFVLCGDIQTLQFKWQGVIYLLCGFSWAQQVFSKLFQWPLTPFIIQRLLYTPTLITCKWHTCQPQRWTQWFTYVWMCSIHCHHVKIVKTGSIWGSGYGQTLAWCPCRPREGRPWCHSLTPLPG